ncbi:MAG: hypothetical protein ACUZ8E_14680, partial [Candidatus Anammoxibacter sp.]
MESINSTSNIVSKPVLNIPGKLLSKRGLVAYNNTDFKSIINSNAGMNYLKNANSIQNNVYNQTSDVKQPD